MSYATNADFVSLYGDRESLQLSNRNNPTALVIDTVRIDKALAAASGIIDSYLMGRYLTPVTPASAEPLKVHTLRLARCELDNVSTREKVQADCDRTMDWLEMVAKGAIELGLPGLPGQLDLAGTTTGRNSTTHNPIQTVADGNKIDISGYIPRGGFF
jgi:phage gp36-like protein